MLDCETESDDIKVKLLSKTNRGKYLSFEIKLPYNKIVTDKTTNLISFTEYLIMALSKAINSFYVIDEGVYKNVLQGIISELNKNPDTYQYKGRKDNIDWEKVEL